VRNGLRLPYQERIRLKKLAQRREKRDKKVEKVMVFDTVNAGSLSGKSMELVDLMERRRINILCVQETKWKGEKAKEIGNGYKLFYYGTNNRRNGVGIILDPEMKKNVLEVNRKSDRLMRVKIKVENRIINIVSASPPQTGCEEEEKEEFGDNLGRVIQNVPPLEVLWVGGDLNGHVGEGNTGSSECMGRHGVGIRNDDGDRIVDWATAGGMALVNTYFMKLEQQKITYKSGNNNTQIDYIACRRQQLKDVLDCKVLPGESVAKQHRPLVCKIKIKTIKPIQQKGIRKRNGGNSRKVSVMEFKYLGSTVQAGTVGKRSQAFFVTEELVQK